MRITEYPPFRSVDHDQYEEGLKYPLALENLAVGGRHIARFLEEKPDMRGNDYRVKIGEIAVRLKRRIWLPQSFRLYPAVKLQPVSLDDEVIGSGSYDTRPVSGRGLIYAQDEINKVVGYFVKDDDETEVLSEIDMEFLKLNLAETRKP